MNNKIYILDTATTFLFLFAGGLLYIDSPLGLTFFLIGMCLNLYKWFKLK